MKEDNKEQTPDARQILETLATRAAETDAQTDARQSSVAEKPQPKESAGTAVSADKPMHDADAPTLREVIQEQATEDERPQSKTFTLSKILGGEVLSTLTIRKQIWLLLLITFFIIVYISNRYSCQQYLIEIDNLNTELQDAKYKALSSSSMLTEMSRESKVLEMLRTNKDSLLHISTQPPFKINVPKE